MLGSGPLRSNSSAALRARLASASASTPAVNSAKHKERGVILASSVGTVFEWYDFYLYATLAPFFAVLFFPPGNDTAALLSAFATYAAGFLIRPFGAVIFGRVETLSDGSTRGRHFGSMDRRAGLGGWDAKRKQGSRRDDAKSHPERSVHELREKAYSYQSEEFKGQGELSDRPQRVGGGLALSAQSKTLFLPGTLRIWSVAIRIPDDGSRILDGECNTDFGREEARGAAADYVFVGSLRLVAERTARTPIAS